MRTALSSAWTPLYRTVLPALWIVGFGAAVWTAWSGALADAPGWLAPALTVLWVGGAVPLVRLARRVRSVWMDGDTLVVHGPRGDRRIPLRAVDDVRETRLSSPRIVRLRLRRSDGSTRWIVFVAQWDLLLPFTSHPDVRRLRERIAAARECREPRLPATLPAS